MPNWCCTKIIFHGNKLEIEDFHKKLDEWTSNALMPNGFGTNWLGNVLCGAGLEDRIDSSRSEQTLRCRGSVTYLEDVEINSDEDATFYIDVETAWSPMVKMWINVIKTLDYKTVGFSYLAEEIGLELYEIYDPYGDFTEKYYVDVWVDGEDEENEKLCRLQDHICYDTDKELIVALQDLLETEESNLSTLIEKARNYPFKSEDSYISIHEYERLNNLDDAI